MSIEQIPQLLSTGQELIHRGAQVREEQGDPYGWIGQAINLWQEGLGNLRTAVLARNADRTEMALMGLLQTMRGVEDSGAPEDYTSYLESDPTPRAFAQITFDAWNDLHDERGLVLDSPEVRARLAAVAQQLEEPEDLAEPEPT